MNMFEGMPAQLITALAGGVMLAIAAVPAAAQTWEPSPYTISSTWTDISAYLYSPAAQPPAIQGFNSSTITQSGGNSNTATVNVTVPSAIGTGSYLNNMTTQTQNGSNNVSNLQAVGNNNILATTQTGNNNTASITAYGSGNTYSSTQNGTGLSFSLQQVGNSHTISVSQRN
jgi:minor curlin subunit